MERAKGILYAALSSSTFGLAPLFTLLLLAGDYSPFEALSYRWGVAVFGEPFTAQGAAGILLIVAAVSVVVLRTGRRPQ